MAKYDPYATVTATPQKNCRSCTDFKTWSKQQRQIFNKSTPDNSSESNATRPSRDDCPLDKDILGNYTWGLLHTMAAFYPATPTDDQKRDTKNFITSLSKVYPCEYCATDFQKDIKVNPINANSQEDLSQWLCHFHNRVNKKLNKPLFDCKRVNERWRDGWLDGSCDA